MNNTSKYIADAIVFSSGDSAHPTNAPGQYSSRQKQYMAERTKTFNSERAYLSTDYVSASVQGITSDFFTWVETDIRLSDVSTSNQTSFAGNKTDDFKKVLFADRSISYFPIGAKLQTMGSTWICINPSNMSTADSTAVIARCNASYNSYDEYGNVVTEPIIVQRADMMGNNSDSPLNLMLMQGYFNVICQKNSNTAKLGENKRIILGDKAYHITGFTDFIQEFSGDRNSAHLLSFTVRVEEPTESDDVTETYIADGNNYTFAATVDGAKDLSVGETEQLTATFVVNGAESASGVSWQWHSSDSGVVKVDQNGNVQAISAGSATVTAKLHQNNNVTASVDINAQESINAQYVKFIGVLPSSIKQYNTVTIEAKYFENGQGTENALQWTEQGDSADYDIEISADGMSADITCINPSQAPLIITASYGEAEASISVMLEGY